MQRCAAPRALACVRGISSTKTTSLAGSLGANGAGKKPQSLSIHLRDYDVPIRLAYPQRYVRNTRQAIVQVLQAGGDDRITRTQAEQDHALGPPKLFSCLRCCDGDTIVLNYPDWIRRHLVVRLLGIDAPELWHPTETVSRFAHRSKKELQSRVSGQTLRLELPLANCRDRYRRLLAYVATLAGTTDLGLSLIIAGWAFPTTRYAHPRRAAYVAAGKAARRARRGLWVAPFLSDMPTWLRRDFVASRDALYRATLESPGTPT